MSMAGFCIRTASVDIYRIIINISKEHDNSIRTASVDIYLNIGLNLHLL